MDWRLFRLLTLRLVVLTLAVVGMASAPLRANHDGVASSAVPPTPLQVCVKPVAASDRADQLLMRPDGFDCAREQSDFGSGDYWARIAVPRAAPDAATMLRWASLWQEGATIVAAYADGSRKEFSVASGGSGRFVHIGATYTLALGGSGPPETLLFRINGSGNLRGILLGAELTNQQQIARTDTRRAALYGGFAGLCIALLIYQLMMWRAMRERYLLAYCATICACMVYALSSSATLAQIFPAIDNNLRLRINYAALAATALAAMWFTRSFLGDAHFSRRFDRLLVAAGSVLALATAAFVLLSPWQIFWLDRSYSLAFVFFFIVGTSMFVRGWIKGGKLERLFALAWLLPVLFNLARLAHGLGLIGHNFWLDNATLVAMSAEALLSSMIIVWRIRLMQEDRDMARAKEAAALMLADTDELTGLANRRALMRAACPQGDATGSYRLILIDIDNFKGINDSVGHSAGDAVLVKVAGVIRAALRPDVIAARIGGEEFALLFPTGNVDRRYYSSLLARVRALPPVGGQRVTISMGAANGWLGGSEGEWLALYRAADAALYEAKAHGRNRLIVSPRYRDLPSAA